VAGGQEGRHRGGGGAAYLCEQADAIRATDPRVRQDAPDAVHNMRVACRRMRSTLQSFRSLLDRTRTDGLVPELRWLAGEFGSARDLEVQRERIGPPELALGPVTAQTIRLFAAGRPTVDTDGHDPGPRRAPGGQGGPPGPARRACTSPGPERDEHLLEMRKATKRLR
jgi:hypothetical protein